MDDSMIVELYFKRDEKAITETQNKYGALLHRIAYSILSDNEDSGECVNDTYMKTWESIPPNRPAAFAAYISKIVRNISISMFRSRQADKREGSQYKLSLDELSECVPGKTDVEGELEVLRTLAPSRGCDCARSVMVTTDDGTMGICGYTTDAMADLMQRNGYTQVYACGPQPMMAGVARQAREAGVDCQCSLERMMGCGFGACSCCNVGLAAGGYALCCQDGPVFDAGEVAW